jgi:molecular chaperone DnaK (HSP70)
MLQCVATDTVNQVVFGSIVLTFSAFPANFPSLCRQALQRLTEAAEKAKIELSALPQTSLNLPFITATADGPKHIDTTLSKAQFEQLCGDLLTRVKRPVEQALRDAKLDIKDIAEVILVGGSTRIPAVQDVVKSMIGKEPNVTVNPDEVVALGAAVQAGVLAGKQQGRGAGWRVVWWVGWGLLQYA